MDETKDLVTRLSVEGTEQVIAAVRKVMDEEKKLRQETEKLGKNASLSTFKKQFEDIGKMATGLLPAFSFYEIARGFVGLVNEANKFALTMASLHKQTGFSTEAVSVWGYAYKKAGKDIDDLQKPLTKMSKWIGEVRSGNKEARGTAAQIFGGDGTGDPFKGLSDDEALQKTTKRLAEFKDSTQKTAIEIKAFGRGAAENIPILDNLGNNYGTLKDEAESAGLIVGPELAKSLKSSKQQMNAMKAETLGLAMQFSAGLTPALTQAFTGLMKATSLGGEGAGAFKKLGEAIGWAAKAIASAFIYVGNVVGAVGNVITTLLSNTWDSITLWSNFDFSHPIDSIKQIFKIGKGVAERDSEALKLSLKSMLDTILVRDPDMKNAFNAIWKQSAPQIKDEGATPGDKLGKDKTKQIRDYAEQIKAAQKEADLARLEMEQTLQSEILKTQEAAAKRQYEMGKLGVEEYYKGRRERMEQEQDAEQARLSGRLKEITGTTPTGDLMTSAKYSLAALHPEQAYTGSTKGDAGEAEEERLKKIAELEKLIQDIEKSREEGKRNIATLTDEEAKATYEAYLKRYQAQLEDEQKRTQAEEDRYNAGDQSRVQTDKNQDAIKQDALRSLREELDVLRELAGQVGGDAVANIDKLAESTEKWGKASNTTATAIKQLKQAVADLMVSGITDFLMNFATQEKSIGEAALDMAENFVKSVLQMMTQALVMKMVYSMLNINGNSGGTAGAIVNLMDGVMFAADGGVVSGGTPGKDSVPAMLMPGEVVLRAASVRSLGLDNALALNKYGSLALRGVQVQHFADGGLVQGAAVDGSSSATMQVGLDSGLVARMVDEHISGPGIKTVIRAAGRNSKAFNSALSKGSKS